MKKLKKKLQKKCLGSLSSLKWSRINDNSLSRQFKDSHLKIRVEKFLAVIFGDFYKSAQRVDSWRVKKFNGREYVIASALETEEARQALAQTMVEPIKTALKYQSIGRKIFMVDTLPGNNNGQQTP